MIRHTRRRNFQRWANRADSETLLLAMALLGAVESGQSWEELHGRAIPRVDPHKLVLAAMIASREIVRPSDRPDEPAN
jgi:hypothetical protein